jgi:hypothetical protein
MTPRESLANWLLAAVISTSESLAAGPVPPSIDELRAADYSGQFEVVRKLDEGTGYSSYLVAYQSGGLRIHAMVATPNLPMPSGGFPVVVANHGFHPDPPRYGITAQGVDSRPGDYYRQIPELFAKHGFLVVMPDYRGHNNSEGLEFTRGFLASVYYTQDVLALLAVLAKIEQADPERVFMWGHSLGGEVSLRALLATDRVKGATIWSSVGGDVWDQAFHYSRYQNPLAPDSSLVAKAEVEQLRSDIAALGVPYDWRAREPMLHLAHLKTPLIIHHAVDDDGAEYRWSVELARDLYLGGHPYAFCSYAGSDHLFTGEQLQIAVLRDVTFFRSLIDGQKPGLSGLAAPCHDPPPE